MKALVDSSGKVMVGSDGKVATDDCPGTCCGVTPPPPPPPTDCTHTISFEIKIDAAEIAFGGFSGDFVRFEQRQSEIGIYIDHGTMEFVLYRYLDPPIDSQSDVRIAIADVPTTLADTWHTIVITLTSAPDSGDVLAKFQIDDVESATFTAATIDDLTMTLDFVAGSIFPLDAISHRSLRNIVVAIGDAAVACGETNSTFHFPPQSFDSFTGTGVSVALDGSLRIDADDDSSNYGEIDFPISPRVPLRLNCCLTADQGAAQTIVFDASFTGHIDTRSPLFTGADVSAATVAKTCTPCVAVCTADPVLITSGSSLCAQTRFAPEVILIHDLDDMDGPWSIDLEVFFNYPDGDTDKCSSAFFGEGSVNAYIVNVALGADPSGSHTFTFNDGENPVANSIVYTYHVTITAMPLEL